MKFIQPAIALLLAPSCLKAASVIDVNNGTNTLTGTTIIRTGDLATFPGANRWASTDIAGTTRTGVTLENPSSSDYYFNFGESALNTGGTISVASARYVEIDYSIAGDWTGSTHQLRLDTSDQAASFVANFTNSGNIPASDGDHTIIIDLLADPGSDPAWSGDWSTFRWDFFNDNGNGGGKSFTINQVEFSSEIAPIPEPSIAILGSLGVLGLLRRRRI